MNLSYMVHWCMYFLLAMYYRYQLTEENLIFTTTLTEFIRVSNYRYTLNNINHFTNFYFTTYEFP